MTHLSLVDEVPRRHRATTAERVRSLQSEAEALAKAHIADLEQQLRTAARTAREVAEGGDAYPVGVRDLAARLQPDLEARATTMEAIVARR